MNSEGIKIPIMICFYIVQRWLSKLGFKYKEVHKDEFMDSHK